MEEDQAAAQQSWTNALKELEDIARLIRGICTEIHDISKRDDCTADMFEKFKRDMDNAEVESRRVKEAIRDSTKMLKAAGLPIASKADRQQVEARYTEIKDDLAKGKQEWREALARARAHETNRAFASKKTELKALLQQTLEQAESKPKMKLEEISESEKVAMSKLQVLRDALDGVVKSGQAVGIDKAQEAADVLRGAEEELSSYFEKRRMRLKQTEVEARRFADALSEYAKWSQVKLAELKACKFGSDESYEDVESRCETILKSSEAKVAEIQSFKLKAPNLESVHQELVVACKAFKDAFEKKKKKVDLLESSTQNIGFVQEPVFIQEVQFNVYREKISHGDIIFTEDEIRKLIDSNYQLNTKGLTLGELAALIKDLAIGIVQSPGLASRASEETDRLLFLVHENFERLINADPKNVELKMNASSNVVNWASLRCKMDHIVYKGQAVFPLLDKALLWIQQVLDASPNDQKIQQSMMDRVRAIEGIRKRTRNLDDSTSSRMKIVLDQQQREIHNLEVLAETLLEKLKRGY